MASPMVAALLVFLVLMVGKAGAGRRCPPVKCHGCSNGYVYSSGCQTCNCKTGPVCPPVLCTRHCTNGYVKQGGCQTCTCLPDFCREKCSRYCAFPLYSVPHGCACRCRRAAN